MVRVWVDLMIRATPDTTLTPALHVPLELKFSHGFGKTCLCLFFLLQAEMEKNNVMLIKFLACFALSMGLCWMQALLTRLCTSMNGQQKRRMTQGW